MSERGNGAGGRPQTTRDVQMRTSTRFSNERVTGARSAPSQSEGGWEVRKWDALVQTPPVKRSGLHPRREEGPRLGNHRGQPGGQGRMFLRRKSIEFADMLVARSQNRGRGSGDSRQGAYGWKGCRRLQPGWGVSVAKKVREGEVATGATCELRG